MVTYILGAGASAHAGYPLTAGLGNALVAWLNDNPTDVNRLYGANLQDLHDYYGGLNDLEKVLTELEECPPSSRAAAMNQRDRTTAVRNMRIMIPEFFRSLRSASSPLYSRIARERISPGDVVITFNYDVALERELKNAGLWDISDGYGFSLGAGAGTPTSQVQVLKLHGSANWLDVLFNGMRGFCQSGPSSLGSRPVIVKGEFDFLGYDSSVRDPLAPNGAAAGAFPAIVLPTLKKRFCEQTSFGSELEEFWDGLWESAGAALSSSERIVIVGYSMPIADERARQLILGRTNRQASIDVYSGQNTSVIRNIFASRGFHRVREAGGRHFEDYLGARN